MRKRRLFTIVCLLVSIILLPINASLIRSAFGDTQNPVDPDSDEVEFCYRTLYGNTCDGPGVVQTSSCSTNSTCENKASFGPPSWWCVFIQPIPPRPEGDDTTVSGSVVYEVINRSNIMTAGESTEGLLEKEIITESPVSCQIVYSCKCNNSNSGCETDQLLYESSADIFESYADGEYCNMEWAP